MVQKTFYVALVVAVLGLLVCPCMVLAQCEGHEEHAAEAASAPASASDEELSAEVPALDDLHEVIFELWHDAFPEKNYAMIKELLPQADELTAKLDEAVLPGILRDKQEAWDAGKEKLKAALAELHAAADADDEDAMLKQTEAFHSAFEGLVRTIRPVVPELDAFHQELYKLYHYHAPDYDLEKIREASVAMKDKVGPLAESKLPKRLESKQKNFEDAVKTLAAAVDDLVETAQKDDKEAVLAAVEKVHTAYQRTEKIFD